MSPAPATTKVFTATDWAAARLHALRAAPAKQALLILRNPAAGGAVAYATRLLAAAAQAGIPARMEPYPDTPGALQRLLANCPEAILPMHPLPPWCDPADLLEAIGAARDAEGLHPLHCGRLLGGQRGVVPPTAQAVFDIAGHLAGPLSGRDVALVGASPVVGQPLALLLMQAGASLRIAQKATRDLAAMTRDAEIVIAAAGVPGLLGREHIAAGAIVIDVGVTRVGDRLLGDVDAEAVAGRAAVRTHVPDGVGPLTCACLLENLTRLPPPPTAGRQ